jgi:hypothetical protein
MLFLLVDPSLGQPPALASSALLWPACAEFDAATGATLHTLACWHTQCEAPPYAEGQLWLYLRHELRDAVHRVRQKPRIIHGCFKGAGL